MKINLVKRVLPDSAPEILRRHDALTLEKAAGLPALLRRVARRYQQLMMQPALFAGKLSTLTVNLHPLMDEDGSPTCAEYTHLLQNNRTAGLIELYANVCDSPRQIAFVFAHELSHMLMDMQTDYCRCFDVCKSGLRPGASCVNRMAEEPLRQMGIGLEESIADRLAMYVVSRCRLSDAQGTYTRHINHPHSYIHLRRFCTLLADAFGDPLEDCRYIDEFTSTALPAGESRLTDRGVKMDAEEYTLSHIRNYFWYSLIANRMHDVIDSYEAHMGEGTWQTLCEHMDAPVITHHYHNADFTAADLSHRDQAEALLQEFARRRKKAWAEQQKTGA